MGAAHIVVFHFPCCIVSSSSSILQQSQSLELISQSALPSLTSATLTLLRKGNLAEDCNYNFSDLSLSNHCYLPNVHVTTEQDLYLVINVIFREITSVDCCCETLWILCGDHFRLSHACWGVKINDAKITVQVSSNQKRLIQMLGKHEAAFTQSFLPS